MRAIFIPVILTTLISVTGLTAPSSRGESLLRAALVPTFQPGKGEHLAIIVNKSNPIDNLSFTELREIFMGRRNYWPQGRRITVVMMEPGAPERAAVLRVIYRMSEKELNRYFLHATFTGAVQATPKLLATAAGLRRFIFNVPGAIGYVSASELDESVKLVRVDGLAPGEPGYKINLQGG